jgi:hypothetical protein
MEQYFIKYVESRLKEWAEWHSKENSGALGFSSVSIQYRLMNEGTIIKTNDARSLPSNADAEEIEAYWTEMYEQNEAIAIAIKNYYFVDSTLRTQSQLMKISHNQFRHYVQMGHQWMAGRLSVLKNRKY